MDTDEKPKLVDAAAVPFLVPCFVQPNTFHPLALFSDGRPPVVSEYSLYAWEESTLVDVTKMLLASLPLHLTSFAAKFAFRMVWFDGRMNTFKQKDLEVVALKAIRDSETSSAAHKSLRDQLFTPGTFLLLAIHGLPAPHQPAAAAAVAAPAGAFAHALNGLSAVGPAKGWRNNGPLPSAGPPEGGAPEGSWTRGGFRGGRGGAGRGGFGGRGGFENGHGSERNGFSAGDRGDFGGRPDSGHQHEARAPASGGWGEPRGRGSFNGGGPSRGGHFAPRGSFNGAPSRGGFGAPPAERSDGWGERSGGWNERPAAGRDAGGWGGGRRDGPHSRSPSPPPQPRRRDYSPEPVVNLRGGRRPSPTY